MNIPFDGKPYVFISYSHKDKGEVETLAARLSKLGYRVWYDGALPYLEDYNEVISNSIKNCSVFLIVLSEDATESNYVQREFVYATEICRKKVAAVQLNDFKLPDLFEFFLTGVNINRKWECSSEDEYFERLSIACESCRGYEIVEPICTSGGSAVGKDAAQKEEMQITEEKKPVTRYSKRMKSSVITAIIGILFHCLELILYFAGTSGRMVITAAMVIGFVFIITSFSLYLSAPDRIKSPKAIGVWNVVYTVLGILCAAITCSAGLFFESIGIYSVNGFHLVLFGAPILVIAVTLEIMRKTQAVNRLLGYIYPIVLVACVFAHNMIFGQL